MRLQNRPYMGFQSLVSDVNTRPAANLTAPCRPGCFDPLIGYVKIWHVDGSLP